MSRKIDLVELQRLRLEAYIEETANVAEEVGGIALRGAVEHIFTLEDPNKLGAYFDVARIFNTAYPGLGHYMAERTFALPAKAA